MDTSKVDLSEVFLGIGDGSLVEFTQLDLKWRGGRFDFIGCETYPKLPCLLEITHCLALRSYAFLNPTTLNDIKLIILFSK